MVLLHRGYHQRLGYQKHLEYQADRLVQWLLEHQPLRMHQENHLLRLDPGCLLLPWVLLFQSLLLAQWVPRHQVGQGCLRLQLGQQGQ